MKLSFGFSEGVPEHVERAWGARLIVTQDGYVDFVHDRQSFSGNGAEDELLPLLREHFSAVVGAASAMLSTGEIKTRIGGEVILYASDDFIVKGDTKGSGGYLYVCAFVPTGDEAPEGAEIDDVARCPKCGDPIDYCQGHGEIADEVLGGRS